MPKEFAAQYPREDGLILFPRDVKERRKLFPPGVFDHPAKNNLFLIKALVDYLTEPGDTILDPFGGTGTLLIATLYNRNVALIELEPIYISLLEEVQEMWKQEVQLPEGAHTQRGQVFIYEGDCRQKLQDLDFLCDAAIFSPPFSTSIMRAKPLPSVAKQVSQYAPSPLNLGNLNPFYFQHGMKLVYERMHKRLVEGAPVAIITRDIIKGTREFLAAGIIRYITKSGYEQTEWFKWKPPGSAQRHIQESRGARVVEDEDILLFRKVG